MTWVDEDLQNVIVQSMASHPRSLQKRIGPSEIGIGCERRLLHKLNGDAEPERGPAWKPAIGTAMHTQLEAWFEADNARLGYMRWVTENLIGVGELDGTTIVGSCDLYDTHTRTVVDWKIVGPKALQNYRANGPSNQYRVQAHLYGLGYFRSGDDWGAPEEVMIAFLPRDGELSRAYYWHERWQPQIALDALSRLNTLQALLTAVGIDAAVNVYPACTEPFCPWCSTAPSTRTGGTFFNPTYGDHAETSPATAA